MPSTAPTLSMAHGCGSTQPRSQYRNTWTAECPLQRRRITGSPQSTRCRMNRRRRSSLLHAKISFPLPATGLNTGTNADHHRTARRAQQAMSSWPHRRPRSACRCRTGRLSAVRSDVAGTALRQAVYVHVVAASDPGSYGLDPCERSGSSGRDRRVRRCRHAQPDRRLGWSAERLIDLGHGSTVTANVSESLLVGVFGLPTNATIAPPSSMLEQAEERLRFGQQTARRRADG